METKKNITLKDWSEMDKPRERLLSQGAKQLTDAELIAILMRTGVPGKNVVEAAKELLASADNSLVTLSLFDYSRLRTFKGMAKLKTVTVGANVTKIGKNAFQSSKKLKTVKIKTKTLKSIGANAFKGIQAKASFKLNVKGTKKAKAALIKKYKKLVKKGKAPSGITLK